MLRGSVADRILGQGASFDQLKNGLAMACNYLELARNIRIRNYYLLILEKMCDLRLGSWSEEEKSAWRSC